MEVVKLVQAPVHPLNPKTLSLSAPYHLSGIIARPGSVCAVNRQDDYELSAGVLHEQRSSHVPGGDRHAVPGTLRTCNIKMCTRTDPHARRAHVHAHVCMRFSRSLGTHARPQLEQTSSRPPRSRLASLAWGLTLGGSDLLTCSSSGADRPTSARRAWTLVCAACGTSRVLCVACLRRRGRRT
jgi:hypothetical protein